MQVRTISRNQVTKTSKSKYDEVYRAIENLKDGEAVFVTGVSRNGVYVTIRRRSMRPVSIYSTVIDGEEGYVIFNKEKK